MKFEDHFRLALRNYLLELAESGDENKLASLLGNEKFQHTLNRLDPELPPGPEALEYFVEYKNIAKILYWMTVFNYGLSLIEREVTIENNGQ